MVVMMDLEEMTDMEVDMEVDMEADMEVDMEVDMVQIMVRHIQLGARIIQILYVLVVMVLLLLHRLVTVVIPKSVRVMYVFTN